MIRLPKKPNAARQAGALAHTRASAAAAARAHGGEFLPARLVRQRYSISDPTLWRWLRDPEMGFPKPIYISKNRYFRLSDLEAWEAAKAAC